MTEEISELDAMLDQSHSNAELMAALKMQYSTLERQVTWCQLSSEFQLHAGPGPEVAEPFAALCRNQRRAVAMLVDLAARKTRRSPALNREEIATSLMAFTHGVALERAAA